MSDMSEMEESIAHLQYRFPELRIDSACGVCPFQAEGALHGMPFYFRFRHNWAELRIQSSEWFQPLYSAGAEFGENEDQGWLSGPDFVTLMTELIGKLERSTIYWEFEGIQGHDVGMLKAGDPQHYGAWAHTPDEAWQRMHEPSQYMISKGFGEAQQALWLAERKMNPQTITVDTRAFPDPDPFVRERG